MKARLIEIGEPNTKSFKIKKLEQDHFETPFHFHEMYELNYIIESNGKRIIGDNISNFSSGDLVLMAPNLPHIWFNDPISIHKKEEKAISKAIVIYFPTDFFRMLIYDHLLIPNLQNLLKNAKRGIRFSERTLQEVSSKLEKAFCQEGLAKTIEFLEAFNILLNSSDYQVLASPGYSHSYNENDTDRLNKVYQYVINRFNKSITLQEVASIANMTPPAFCNFFKKRTQKSFTNFLNGLRIGHACKLLIEDDSSVAEVCYDCGYQNLTHFNKCFKRIMNKTPTQYRKEN